MKNFKCLNCENCCCCKDCANCENCNNCNNCSNCVDCIDCENCHDCVGLVGKSDQTGLSFPVTNFRRRTEVFEETANLLVTANKLLETLNSQIEKERPFK